MQVLRILKGNNKLNKYRQHFILLCNPEFFSYGKVINSK